MLDTDCVQPTRVNLQQHIFVGTVKRRPPSTTSERQLLLAMADSGRPVTLAELVRWRKFGLLPRLASHGLGKAKGKSYYWREDNIVAQARAAYDALAAHGRPDCALSRLWLSGFAVPLPQLRRAWSGRSRFRKMSGAIRPGTGAPSGNDMAWKCAGIADDTSQLLLNAALSLCGSLAPEKDEERKTIIALIERALARLGHAGARNGAGVSAEHLWEITRVLTWTLEDRELVARASDDDLRDTQNYLVIAARFLQDSSGAKASGVACWSPWLAEQLGPPLAVLILVILQSGKREYLDRAAADIGAAGWRAATGRRERPSPAPVAPPPA
jgi:hypothetical protein